MLASKTGFGDFKMSSPAVYQLRLPKSIKAAVERYAKADGISMNQFMATAVAEKLSALESSRFFLRIVTSGSIWSVLTTCVAPVDRSLRMETKCLDSELCDQDNLPFAGGALNAISGVSHAARSIGVTSRSIFGASVAFAFERS